MVMESRVLLYERGIRDDSAPARRDHEGKLFGGLPGAEKEPRRKSVGKLFMSRMEAGSRGRPMEYVMNVLAAASEARVLLLHEAGQ